MTPITSPSRQLLASTVWLALLTFLPAHAGEITPALERSMAHKGTHADTAVIMRFTDSVELQTLPSSDRQQGNEKLLRSLKERAARHRAAIEPALQAQGAVKVRDLWLINAVALTVPAVAVKILAALDGVAMVDLDAYVQGGRSQRTPAPRNTPGEAASVVVLPVPATAPPDFKRAQPGWNLTSIHAPELWAMGHTGKGVVVATMDTGVDGEHPDLRGKWRGGTNSWFDPHGEELLPYDALGHGTQSLAVVLGNPDIGVAPEARWIGVRLYDNNGRASMSDIHLGFQWLIDPDGDPATADAPQVVNASWALTGRAVGSCIMEFSEDIRALKSAGIAVVFAAGNDGPFPNTSNSPGNNPGVMSVGAIDQDQEIARQTSRGPSSCDRSVFPRVMAPGVNVRTADLSHGGQPSYTTVSGSSLAAPHVSGVMALLAGAFPSASVAELEAAVLTGAKALGGAGQNSGYRGVDALAAFNALRARSEATSGETKAVALNKQPSGTEKSP
jgi:bacillopeptidase F